jgi:hypothetical protein
MYADRGRKMRITQFHETTGKQVQNILEQARESRSRLRIWYGDVKTGQAWDEEHDVVCYIGRSTGEKPIPLSIYNERSLGGGGILDHCIIRIDRIKDRRTLYIHPNFNAGSWTIEKSDLPGYTENALKDGEIIARLKKNGQAQRYIDFMTGKRYSK